MKKFVDKVQEIAVTICAFLVGVFVASLIFSIIQALGVELVETYVFVVIGLIGVGTASAGNIWLDLHK